MKSKKNGREGRCVAAAYEDLTEKFKDGAISGDIKIVHGWVLSHKLNASIKHAWIEFVGKDVIYEPVSQKILDKNLQEFFRMRPVKKYGYYEIMKHSARTGFKGGKFEF